MTTSGPIDRPRSQIFHAITVVWGREYLDLFLNRCIPNQLGEGNLPALPQGSRYRIMTRAMHVDEVQAHPMVQALARIVPVDVVAVAALEGVDQPDPTRRRDRRFELMTVCHRQAIGDALAADAALIFLAPDIVLSAGAFASIVQRHRAGYRAVVCTGLRLEKESFLEAIDDSRAARALPPRDLVRLALPRLHAHTRSMFVDAKAFSTFPVGIYWPVGAEGLLARCFHLHPLMIDPIIPVLPRRTIDGRYLEQACPDAARVHVVSDSDELQMFELTTVTRRIGAGPWGAGASAWRAAAVAAVCDDLQIGYWRQYPVRLHTGEFDARWSVVAATADAFAKKVLRLRKYGRMARRGIQFFERTRQRRERCWKAWRRRLPRVTFKQILRPVRVAAHRSTKTLRKTLRRATHRVFRQTRAR